MYRGTQPLSTPERIKSAERIAVITDRRETHTDRTITATGTYFYAVTASDMAGNEDLQLIPDQSYMTRGVYVAFISEATVKTHLLRIFTKLGVTDRTRAVTVALDRGLIGPPA